MKHLQILFDNNINWADGKLSEDPNFFANYSINNVLNICG